MVIDDFFRNFNRSVLYMGGRSMVLKQKRDLVLSRAEEEPRVALQPPRTRIHLSQENETFRDSDAKS